MEEVTKCERVAPHANIEKDLDVAFRFASIIIACYADYSHIRDVAIFSLFG